jgi:acetolactate synthase-1/3 small subunit
MSAPPVSPSSHGEGQPLLPKPVLEPTKAVSGDEEIVHTKIRKRHSHAIVYAIVENQRGVLHRISSMFRAKGFNIASIAIGRTSHPELARMTIVPSGDEASLSLLVKQLRKMIDVIEVGTMTRGDSIARELALVKFETPSAGAKREILDLTNSLGGRAVDTNQDSLVVEFCSTPEGIDSFIEEAAKSEVVVKEVVRTGLTALRRD